MFKISVPYYTGNILLEVEQKNLKAIITPKEIKKSQDIQSEKDIILNSLKSPIDSKRLCELAVNKKKIVIITSDHTRSVPSKITLPLILSEIRSKNPKVDITILIATGLHRPTTEDEQRKMFGDTIVDNETIIVSNAYKSEDFVFICNLTSGTSFNVHKEAYNCDLLIAEGFIEPHFFAGFSGGRKSVLPGICSEKTINENHSYKAIANLNAKAGVLKNNPINEDMEEAAKRINLQFILNVALDSNKKVIASFSGDMQKAYEKGVEFVREISQCNAVKGDIIVTGNGGYPLDQNLYQSVKAVSTAESCANDAAVIVMCCSCADGIGGEHFEQIMTGGNPSEMMSKLSGISPSDTIPEQWNAQIYFRILLKYKVIIVSDFISHELIEKANMIPANTIEQAMEIAFEVKGKDASVVVIPDGVSVFINQ